MYETTKPHHRLGAW